MEKEREKEADGRRKRITEEKAIKEREEGRRAAFRAGASRDERNK